MPYTPKVAQEHNNMEYHPAYTTSVSVKVAAYGALVHLLSEAVQGAEYDFYVENDKSSTVYTLRIPVWAELSGQSKISLDGLIRHADEHTENTDSLFHVHTFRVA